MVVPPEVAQYLRKGGYKIVLQPIDAVMMQNLIQLVLMMGPEARLQLNLYQVTVQLHLEVMMEQRLRMVSLQIVIMRVHVQRKGGLALRTGVGRLGSITCGIA